MVGKNKRKNRRAGRQQAPRTPVPPQSTQPPEITVVVAPKPDHYGVTTLLLFVGVAVAGFFLIPDSAYARTLLSAIAAAGLALNLASLGRWVDQRPRWKWTLRVVALVGILVATALVPRPDPSTKVASGGPPGGSAAASSSVNVTGPIEGPVATSTALGLATAASTSTTGATPTTLAPKSGPATTLPVATTAAPVPVPTSAVSVATTANTTTTTRVPSPVKAYNFNSQETVWGQPYARYTLNPRQWVFQPFSPTVKGVKYTSFSGLHFVATCSTSTCIVKVFVYSLPNGTGTVCESPSFGLKNGWNGYDFARGKCPLNPSLTYYAQVYATDKSVGSVSIWLVNNAGRDPNLNAFAPHGQVATPANTAFDAEVWLQQ